MPEYFFKNDPTYSPPTGPKDWPVRREPYIASPQLRRAVNLAIYLRRPLLIEGEVGCGKTRLAYAVAHQLGLPLFPWFVRSTSKVEDGLYSYDAVARLHDVQIAARLSETMNAPLHDVQPSSPPDKAITSPAHRKLRNPADPASYLTFGPIGKAFRLRSYPAVVLIDEIDKASYDFPNDLLDILDRPWSFTIPATGETITAAEENLPIVIITSNRERSLSPAFTRRCVYTVIDLQSRASDLANLAVLHYEAKKEFPHYKERKLTTPDKDFIEAAVNCFLALRNSPQVTRKPGISEFLDWIWTLSHPNPLWEQQEWDRRTLWHPELLLKDLTDLQNHTTDQGNAIP